MQFELKAYEDDLVLVGIGMDAERYEAIKAELPADIRGRIIGWKRLGR